MILGVGHFEDKLSNDWPRDERSDEPAGARKPGRPRQSGVEERVLQATLEMIDTGVTVTVSEIVERSGVNRGAIYRRWASLTSLIADALDVGRTLPAPINAQTDNIQEAFFHALVDPTSDGSSGVYPRPARTSEVSTRHGKSRSLARILAATRARTSQRTRRFTQVSTVCRHCARRD